MFNTEQLKFLLDMLNTPGMVFTLDRCRVAADTHDLIKAQLVVTKAVPPMPVHTDGLTRNDPA